MTHYDWLKAIYEGDTYKIEWGLKNDNWINQRTGETTALMCAASMGDEKTVQALLDAGALVNDTPRGINNPLIWAARRGSLNIVNALIERGADLNHQNGSGETALSKSIYQEDNPNSMDMFNVY